jgi:hypothetical protein
MPNLLVACDGSAAHLEKILSKDELKAECAARSLPLSGTKAVLAPRLLQALIVEAATQAATQADMQAAPLPPPLPADLLPQSAASPAPAATRPTRASAATKPPALATDAIKSVDTTCAVPAVDAAARARAMHRRRTARIEPEEHGCEHRDARDLAGEVLGVEGDADRAGLADALGAVVGRDAYHHGVHAGGDAVPRHAIAALDVGQVQRPGGDTNAPHAPKSAR